MFPRMPIQAIQSIEPSLFRTKRSMVQRFLRKNGKDTEAKAALGFPHPDGCLSAGCHWRSDAWRSDVGKTALGRYEV